MKSDSADISKEKALSSSFATGGGGHRFEDQVQSAFVALLAAEGFAPCIEERLLLKEIKLQGRHDGYATDDLIAFAENAERGRKAKLLVQIKYGVTITPKDHRMGEVLKSAWRDFNNPELFDPTTDRILLITGPLSKKDADAPRVLEWARSTIAAEVFFGRFKQANFCDDNKRRNLEAFRTQLDKAKDAPPITDEELWGFLRCFHLLGCDFDVKDGLLESVFRSLVSRNSPLNYDGLWERIVHYTQNENQNAGVITRESLPEEIVDALKPRQILEMPHALKETSRPDFGEYPTEVMFALLVGAWDEKGHAGDIAVIEELVGSGYAEWIDKIRKVSQLSDSPITLDNGRWKTSRHLELWQELAAYLYDNHVDRFGELAVRVLSEQDPALKLSPEERYVLQTWQHSGGLRKGVATTLAFLNSGRVTFARCSSNKIEAVVSHVVRTLLAAGNWERWASLDGVLPQLAEAAPQVFLDVMEETLGQSPCPFEGLFAQERSGLLGRTYMASVLWAMEGLAWDSQLLVRSVVVLGHLASIDPGGNWRNRPAESLARILLAWLPQTLATVDTRRAAVDALCDEFADVGWQLLLKLLPGALQHSMPTHRPMWRSDIPEETANRVSHYEYRKQADSYSTMAVEIAKQDTGRLTNLVEHIAHLWEPARENLLDYLKTEASNLLDEEDRTKVATNLRQTAAWHSSHPGTPWALSRKAVDDILETAEAVAPRLLANRILYLFSDGRRELLDGSGSYEEQQKRLDNMRRDGVEQLYRESGFVGIIELARRVESPRNLGATLAWLETVPLEREMLPSLLLTAEQALDELVRGYVWCRFYRKGSGWEWADAVDMTSWTHEQKAQFLACLPFTPETWKRVSSLLDGRETPYWTNTQANPSDTTEDLSPAVEHLLEVDRTHEAVDCIWRMVEDNRQVNAEIAVAALKAVLNSSSSRGARDDYAICKIIKSLQSSEDVPEQVMAGIEWSFLSLLGDTYDVRPATLERWLAVDASFFVGRIRDAYRGKNRTADTPDASTARARVAENTYDLLSKWNRPPGVQDDGSFDAAHFKNWLEQVRSLSAETGHLDAALTHAGQVLIHCPPDPDGLWLPRCVAEILNAPDNDGVREGFWLALFNSRGVYRDTEGQEERDLAEKYEQRARDVERYRRLAAELRRLAEHYRREATTPPVFD